MHPAVIRLLLPGNKVSFPPFLVQLLVLGMVYEYFSAARQTICAIKEPDLATMKTGRGAFTANGG